MIMSDSCFIYDGCKKYQSGECKLQEDEFCIKLYKLDYLYSESLLTQSQRNYIPLRIDADGTDREEFSTLKVIENNIEQFVETGSSLYIYSKGCGNGKTAWSIRLMQAYLNRIWYKCDLNCKVLFISVPKLLLALKDNISDKSEYVDHIKKNVFSADLVVWDEIGTKAVTRFEHEHLLSFINSRIDNGKSQVFTSNLSPEELRASVGDRLYSRVINLSTVLQFRGSDKRGIK